MISIHDWLINLSNNNYVDINDGGIVILSINEEDDDLR